MAVRPTQGSGANAKKPEAAVNLLHYVIQLIGDYLDVDSTQMEKPGPERFGGAGSDRHAYLISKHLWKMIIKAIVIRDDPPQTDEGRGQSTCRTNHLDARFSSHDTVQL